MCALQYLKVLQALAVSETTRVNIPATEICTYLLHLSDNSTKLNKIKLQ